MKKNFYIKLKFQLRNILPINCLLGFSYYYKPQKAVTITFKISIL